MTQNNITVSFHPPVQKTEAVVDVTFTSHELQINNLTFVHRKIADGDNTFHVNIPKDINDILTIVDISWQNLHEKIIKEYKRQILEEKVDTTDELVKIEFRNIQELIVCLVDVMLPHKMNPIKGFRLKKFKSTGNIVISTPKTMGRRWNDDEMPWYRLCSIISAEYNKYEKKQKNESNQDIDKCLRVDDIENSTVLQNEDKEKNEFGRTKNARNSSFRFYPRTVLRSLDQYEIKKSHFKLRFAAANAMSSGIIGPFEINILKWISKLRYVTSTMLLDLIKAGYVYFGWRNSIRQDKLTKIVNRMSNYELITLTRFMTVNEDGKLYSDSQSVMRIITLGYNGSILLRELKNICIFNAFDIVQDGNTVKRYLVANQWLIYWLTTYKKEIGENYETNFIINMRGTEYVGIRIYATATINSHTMVAEPVRRVEDFEIESCKQSLREKIARMTLIFDNIDRLYYGSTNRLYRGTEVINFPERPVIVLVCEDDEHIRQTWEDIRDILPDDNRQIIWFSSDLRIFNYDKKGERFLYFEDDTMKIVDIKQVLGVDDES